MAGQFHDTHMFDRQHVCNIQEKTVSLVVAYPTSETLNRFSGQETKDNLVSFVSDLTAKISKFVKSGGICCLALDYEQDATSDSLVPIHARIMDEISKNAETEWHVLEEIIWVHGKRNDDDAYVAADYSDIPFTQIYVLEKQPARTERKSRSERGMEMDVLESEMYDMASSVWYSQPSSNRARHESLPRDIISKLISVYSYIDDVVLDPLSTNRLVADVSKDLRRNSICLTADDNKID